MNRNQVEVLFYSDKNVDILLQIIDQHLVSDFGLKISQDEEYLLFEIMRIKYENRILKKENENIYQYIRKLNQDTLRTVIDIIKKKLNNQQQKVIEETTDAFEKLQKEREIKPPQQPKVNFTSDIENDNSIIIKKFEKVVEHRDKENQLTEQQLKLKTEEELLPLNQNEVQNIPLFSIEDIKTNVEDKIVKLPEKEYEEIQEYTFMVDSRERQNYSTTNSNSYTIQFDKPFKNIVSLELLTTELPITQYVVNDYNNKLKIDSTTITITNGNYTSSELASEIETKIDTTTGDSNYSVSANDITMKFTISHSSTNFTLDLSVDNNIAKVIGFNATSQTGALTYTSQNTYDLFGEKYIVMHVNNFASNIVSNQEKLEGAFAKIPLTQPLYSVEYFNYDKLRAFKEFHPPLASLDYLNLEFRTYGGQLYDFNGQDHSLTFLIKTKTYRKNMHEVEI
jgi:hypothetical protein